ncbi:MAG TPA: hypothetical protein PKZ78_04755, partial [Candidatus Goldiibacteriota bacterium]|nr:hypothetical protein [Candidatus Goldiibacteriota bacterium]
MKNKAFIGIIILLTAVFFLFSCGKKNSFTAPSPAPVISTNTPADITPLPTAVNTATTTNTVTRTVIPADSSTSTPTITITNTISINSATVTLSSTATLTQSNSATATSSSTVTMTHTATPPFTETATPTASVTSTYNSPTLTVTVTNTNVVTYNSGTASASTNPLFSGVYGNKVTITFNCGSISWQGPSPIYGTLRIIVPEGWSLPSLAGNNAGYYEVSLPSGGQLVGIDAVDRTMIIKVASLPAVTGKVAVTYGSMSSGGPGA